MSSSLTNIIHSSLKTVKESKKQRKEAKLIKQLDKQIELESAEKANHEQSQDNKGNLVITFDIVILPVKGRVL